MTHAAAPQLPSLAAAIGPIALIPELTRFGLHQLIELEAHAVFWADRHGPSEESQATATASGSSCLTTLRMREPLAPLASRPLRTRHHPLGLSPVDR